MAYEKFVWKNKGEGENTPLNKTHMNHLEEGIKGEEERAISAEDERLERSENLKDLASASTARTNLGLGTAATSASTAFDAAGAAATAQSNAEANSIPSSAKGKANGVPSSVDALAISGTPEAGQVLTATSASAADWQTGASMGAWEALTLNSTNVEEGSHPPMVRKEGNGILRFKGALKAKKELVPAATGPTLASSPIAFKGGGSGSMYALGVRYVLSSKLHEAGVVLEFYDTESNIWLAGGPTIKTGDQIDLDGITLTLE